MGNYRRILGLIAANGDGIAVAQRALQMARVHHSTLALATVIEPGPETTPDGVEFHSPGGCHGPLMRNGRERLQQMTLAIGCDCGCEIIVCQGSQAKVVAELTSSWQPDLVLVDARTHLRTEPRRCEHPAYDILLVRVSQAGFTGRVINALAGAL